MAVVVKRSVDERIFINIANLVEVLPSLICSFYTIQMGAVGMVVHDMKPNLGIA